MTNTKDDTCLEFVSEKMIGNLLLLDGLTEEQDMHIYKELSHVNYFTKNNNGFLCVALLPEFVFIPYAWYDGSFSAQRAMVRLGKQLYQHYTIEKNMPIYYSGLKNFYPNHSEEVTDKLWIFKP